MISEKMFHHAVILKKLFLSENLGHEFLMEKKGNGVEDGDGCLRSGSLFAIKKKAVLTEYRMKVKM